MIGNLVGWSARHALLVLALTVVTCAAGYWCMRRVPLDALPDLGDTQVILYSRWDRSPDQIENQITYPIITSLMGAPRVKTVRGISDFGSSFVYVIFQDGTDPYWARSRTLEYLAGLLPSLPQGSKTVLGPDASSLGWVYQYALVDPTGHTSPEKLRALQDWSFRLQLQSVEGVAEVASLGGLSGQYQVVVDPVRLQRHGISIQQVVDAVRSHNRDGGGDVLEAAGAEYMIRGQGSIRSLADLEQVGILASSAGAPVLVRDVADVNFGHSSRRGVADLDGKGDVVSGIVVMRSGENTLRVIERVRDRLEGLRHTLPAGVQIVTVYDRSELVNRVITNLHWTLIEIVLTVSLVILFFLWHLPSAVVPIAAIPAALLIAFIPFYWIGLSANIMSLAGLAIAIGAMVDASIVMVEQVHKRLEAQRDSFPLDITLSKAVAIDAAKEVADPAFYAMLIIAVSFLPVLALEGQEGRLFTPLALAKTFAMLAAALLSVTLAPALRILLLRPAASRPHHDARNTINEFLIRRYRPVCRWALEHKVAVLTSGVLLLVATLPAAMRLQTEFMPPLDEGALLYMPTTAPGISVAQSQRVLQATDQLLKQFPEVDHVLGKAGRAETATDPAPLSMLETLISLKPKSDWRKVSTWYSGWAPESLKTILRHVTPDTISLPLLIDKMNLALQLPGVMNAWTGPIKGRVDMLSTGLRTPLGLKITGPDAAGLDSVGRNVESLLRTIKGTGAVFAERANGGYFLDIQWQLDLLARYGITVDQVQELLAAAIGGDNITAVYEGRAQYPVSVRLPSGDRSTPDGIAHIRIPIPGGSTISLGELASIKVSSGSSMLRDENGQLTAYVYIDPSIESAVAYQAKGRALLSQHLHLPPGYAVTWSGEYASMQRVRERLLWVVPLTLLAILGLLLANTRSFGKAMLIFAAVPFSAVGAVWLLYLLNYKISLAVWLGLIALLGVDAETGSFMLLYLDMASAQWKREGRLHSNNDLRDAIIEGAVLRIRPKLMTVLAMIVGLVPILWSTGTGSEVMKRIAAPLAGGIFTSFLLELLLYPVIYELWKGRTLSEAGRSISEVALSIGK